MRQLEICMFFSFLISAALMPIADKIAIRIGAVSEVGGRHVGRVPIGRLGGAGIVISVLVTLTLINLIDDSIRSAVKDNGRKVFGFLFGLLFFGGVGFWDDIKRLTARAKLGAQLVGGVVVYGFGLRISGLDLPFFEPFQVGVLGLPMTLIWIVGIVNAVNLIDGLDGLAGGVILFAALVNLVAAITSFSILTSILLSAVVGSVFAFLLYNWYPAKIFLGDGGAYSLGYILASCSLIAPNHKATTCVSLIVPVLAAGLPIFDTFLTMLRRYLGGRGIFSPDRGHLHHILLDAGISHRRVVIGLYGLSSVLCSVALLMVLNRNRDIGIALLFASVVGLFFWGISVRAQLRDALKNMLISFAGAEKPREKDLNQAKSFEARID